MSLPFLKRRSSVCRLIKTVARPVLSPFFRLRAEGREHLPRNQAFILLPKHQRWVDIPLVALATPRTLYYMAKYELFTNPLSGWFLSSAGGIPLNRQRPLESRRSLKAMIELLQQGEGIVIFPEGTYYKERMGPGHTGLIRMVQSRFTIPFIPVGIRYSPGRLRTHVRVTFGLPIYKEAADDKNLLHRIMKEIARLSGL